MPIATDPNTPAIPERVETLETNLSALSDSVDLAKTDITSLFTAWVPLYASTAEVLSATISASTPLIRIGAQKVMFQRATGVQTLGRIQSADGAYWEPAGEVISTHHGVVIAQGNALTDAIGMGRAAFAAYKLDKPYSVEHEETVAMSFNINTEAFNEDGDEAEYNSRVASAYRTTTDRTFYDTEWTPGASEGYKAHMARAHGLFKVADWFSKCPRTGIGTFFVQPNNGAHYIFGIKKLEGFNGYFRIKGKNLTSNITVSSIAFAAHPTLGSNYSIATIVFDGSVQSAGMTVVPDMCAVIRQCKSTAAEGVDGARLINGAFCIESISTTSVTDDTITTTVYNPYNSLPANPTTLDTADGALDEQHGSSVIYGCQFLITGGFNDRFEESFSSGVDGAEIFEEQIAWVDATDQRVPIYGDGETIATPGVDPERKGRFTGLQSRYRAQSVAICGFDGRVIRASKGSSVAFNLVAIGGIGKFKEGLFGAAERGIDAQLASHMEGIRCVIGNVRSFGIGSSTGSHFVFENCSITGTSIAGRGLTFGMIDLSATDIAYCPTGAFMDGNSTLVVNSTTRFFNCTTGIDLRDDANLSGGIPQFDTVTTPIKGRKPGRLADTTTGGPLNEIDMVWTAANAQGWRDIVVDVRNIIVNTNLSVLELLVQIDGVWITTASYSWRYTDFATDSASSVATRMGAGASPETESEVLHGIGSGAGDLAAVKLTVRDFSRGSNPIIIEHEGYAVDTGTRARYVKGVSYVEGVTGTVTGIRLKVKGGTALVNAGAQYKITGQ